MSNCLDNWIGIYGCDAPSNVSGVYINSLPGISMASLEKLANDEQVTYLGVWLDIQTRGIKKFYNRIQTELSKKYRLKSLRATVDLGDIVDISETTVPTGQYRGFTYELRFENEYRKSNFQAVSFQKLKLYLPTAVNTTVKIVDLDTAEVLFTSSVTGVAGWNTIQVNQRFTSQRLFIGYLDSGITSVSLPLNSTNQDWFNSYLYSFYGTSCQGYLRGAITGTTFDNDSPLTITTSTDSYGMSAVFSLLCSNDFLICNNKDLFTTPLLYLLGAECMIERQYSTRLNRFTTIDRDKAVDLEKYFMQEFENEIQVMLDGIDISTQDSCIECNRQIQVLEAVM